MVMCYLVVMRYGMSLHKIGMARSIKAYGIVETEKELKN